jgi:hypothetical protein
MAWPSAADFAADMDGRTGRFMSIASTIIVLTTTALTVTIFAGSFPSAA